MSVAGLRFQPLSGYANAAPQETKSGSYIYEGSASGFHDWEFRTKVRVLQHRERQRREVLKDMRSTEARSQSPRKWRGGAARKTAVSSSASALGRR